MTSEEMIDGVKEGLIDLGLESYVEVFNEGVDSESAKYSLDPKIHVEKLCGEGDDNYWSESSSLYNSLSYDQKRVFFNIVRQIQIDTIASFLSFLDGDSLVEGQEEDLELVCLDNPDVRLNGELSDIFLNKIYEWKR